jgi:prefoldin subunit 5
METLRQQALGIISVCKTALAGKGTGKGKEQHPVDNQTIAIAQAILAQAKAALPDDKVLAAVHLGPHVHFWTSVQTAMEIIDKSIPSPESMTLGKRMEEARKRVEKHEQSITDAIASYKSALAEYAKTECPSYSTIEIAKLKVADAFLDSRKIPRGPAKQTN